MSRDYAYKPAKRKKLALEWVLLLFHNTAGQNLYLLLKFIVSWQDIRLPTARIKEHMQLK